MSAKNARSGHCLCGKVTFTISEGADEVGVCHCDMCRRWAGAPWFAVHCKTPVTFEGEKQIVRYRSSDWAERGFCGTCGSYLFYRILASDEYFISPFAFEDQSGLSFTSQVFIDEKPDWYAFANETKNMTGAEVFAMHAPSGDNQG